MQSRRKVQPPGTDHAGHESDEPVAFMYVLRHLLESLLPALYLVQRVVLEFGRLARASPMWHTVCAKMYAKCEHGSQAKGRRGLAGHRTLQGLVFFSFVAQLAHLQRSADIPIAIPFLYSMTLPRRSSAVSTACSCEPGSVGQR